MRFIRGLEGHYAPLANDFIAPMEFQGIHYWSASHAFAAARTTDPDLKLRISQINSPTHATEVSLQVEPREGWNEGVGFDMLRSILLLKFGFGAHRRLLANTGRDLIVHDNKLHDQVWGNCICGTTESCDQPGINLLGLCLSEVRAQIVAEDRVRLLSLA